MASPKKGKGKAKEDSLPPPPPPPSPAATTYQPPRTRNRAVSQFNAADVGKAIEASMSCTRRKHREPQGNAGESSNDAAARADVEQEDEVMDDADDMNGDDEDGDEDGEDVEEGEETQVPAKRKPGNPKGRHLNRNLLNGARKFTPLLFLKVIC